MKHILYVDMDNVLVDFRAGIARLDPVVRAAHAQHLDEVPGIFENLPPMPGAIDAFHELCGLFDTYVLSTAPWNNPPSWTQKLLWVQRHLGPDAYKRLILTHHKDLNAGDFLVDDRPNNGASRFRGEWIAFGSPEFPDWAVVLPYLRQRAVELADTDANLECGSQAHPG